MDFSFWVKKFLSFHLHPLPLALELLVIGFVLTVWGRWRDRPAAEGTGGRRRNRAGNLGMVFLAGGILALYLQSIPAVSGPLVYALERRYPPLDLEALPEGSRLEPEFIVVLSFGERVHPEKPPFSQLPAEAFLRLMEGVRLMRHFPQASLVFTGSPREVQGMHRAARALGIEESRIVEETDSRDTSDHARFLKSRLAGRQFILATSGTHMPRAMGLFQRQGLNPVAAPCDLWEWPDGDRGLFQHWMNYLPDSSSLSKTHGAVHEYLGLAWERLAGPPEAGGGAADQTLSTP